MSFLYGLNAPKKSTNVSINSDFLQHSKELNANLSAILEQASNEKLAMLESDRWKVENKSAIYAYLKN